MSLLEMQNFLARVFTDAPLRRAFLEQPEKVGFENNLSRAEIEKIKQILPEQINHFSDSLVWKRLREVEKLLPVTSQALGKDFEKHFQDFSARFPPPQSIKKHLDDALAFADFLQTMDIQPVWTKSAAKFERARLEFNFSPRRRFLFERFEYDVREIFKALHDVRATARAQNLSFPKRKTFAVWFRFGGKARSFVR